MIGNIATRSGEWIASPGKKRLEAFVKPWVGGNGGSDEALPSPPPARGAGLVSCVHGDAQGCVWRGHAFPRVQHRGAIRCD